MSITEDLLMAATNQPRIIVPSPTMISASLYKTRKAFYITMVLCGQKKNNPNFSIAMGTFHSTEAYELLGVMLLWYNFDSGDTGLYRDDGVIFLRKANPQQTPV